MITRPDLSDKFAADSRSLDGLKQSVKDNSPEAIKTTAKQFEALYVNMMLKSMRQAGGEGGGPFDSEQSKMYTSMLDQQLSQKMASGKGIGLADALVRQLSNNAANQITQSDGSVPDLGFSSKAIDSYLSQQMSAQQKSAQAVDGSDKTATSAGLSPAKEFQMRLQEHAEIASQETGIPAKFMLGQAALESGWGKHEIKATDGSASHNIFGMKATSAWKGKTVNAVTTEYVNGVAHKKVEKFKAYDSYSDAFKDYAKTLTNNPRYENVIANAKDATSFAHGLQRAGYATDPQYANKLSRIIKQTLST